MPEVKHIGSFVPEKNSMPRGENYLYVIAINEYSDCPKLYNPVKDAKELVQVLSAQYYFEKENVICLFNKQATASNILNNFRDITNSLTSQDNLVIFFSGHGEYDEVFQEGYWVPVGAKKGALEDYIPNSKIRTILNAISAHHIFLMVDSCFSGSLFRNQSKNLAIQRLERDPSRWGLTSGRNEIVDDGKPGENSPFADSLIYHLRNNDRSLGVMELCVKVMEEVTANAQQTPKGDALSIRGHKGGQLYFHPKEERKLKEPLKQVNEAEMGAAQYTNEKITNWQKLIAILAVVVISFLVYNSWQTDSEILKPNQWQDTSEREKGHPESTIGMDKKSIYSIGIIGEATSLGWDKDIDLKRNAIDSNFWSIQLRLTDGQVKFRANDSWDLNWGNVDYPEGRGMQDGDNILVEEGEYYIEFNSSTKEYSFKLIDSRGNTNTSKKKYEPTIWPIDGEKIGLRAKVIKELEKNMILIEGGEFKIGCAPDKFNDCDDTELKGSVISIKNFRLNRYEVTQEEWRAVMEENPPEIAEMFCDSCPVHSINQKEVEIFLKKLNELTRQSYRLPSESEWEYATRGRKRNTFKYSGSNDIYKVAKFNGNSEKINKVGSKIPNNYGLFDMSGNVWEMCADKWNDSLKGIPRNGEARKDGEDGKFVRRGGSYISFSEDCRVFCRRWYNNHAKQPKVGFRLALDVE